MAKKAEVNALYAGSFDPFTVDHFDVCQRALKICDNLKIVIAKSPTKTPLLSWEKRVALIQELFTDYEQVEVVSWSGLIIDYAKENKINVMVRGLRPTGDFDNEFQMALMNRNLGEEVETIFFVSDATKSYISSSLVREIWGHNGDISEFVPGNVLRALKEKK